MVLSACPDCHGSRLRPEALNIHIGEKTIAELADLGAVELREWIAKLKWKSKSSWLPIKL